MSKNDLVEQIGAILRDSKADYEDKIAALNVCWTSLNLQKQLDSPYNQQKIQSWREKRLKQGEIRKSK